MPTSNISSAFDDETARRPKLRLTTTTQLACDECYPRRARATWSWTGTDALGRAWRAVVCQAHLALLDEEIAERGGSGSLEPIHVYIQAGV